MLVFSPHRTNCESLAEQLDQDILRRRLKPGDRYITAIEAAKQLGVSRMSADRAMSLLVKRKTLVRQRGRGTFVGPNINVSPATSVVQVHLLVFIKGELNIDWLSQSAIIAGLRTVMPSAVLHMHFLPFEEGAHLARQLVQGEDTDSQSVWVLAASPQKAQQWFAKESIAAIVLGEAYPGISLPDMEADQTEAGVHLLRLAWQLGARRFTFINTQNWRQGDTAALNGALQELGNLGNAADRLEVCNIPKDADEEKRILRKLIPKCSGPRSEEKRGLLCRSHRFVEVVLDIADELGVTIPDDLIVVYSRYWTENHPIAVPCVDEVTTTEEGFAMIAALAKRILSGQKYDSVRLPVRFVFPEGYEFFFT